MALPSRKRIFMFFDKLKIEFPYQRVKYSNWDTLDIDILCLMIDVYPTSLITHVAELICLVY